MPEQRDAREGEEREELRPGLVMVRRRTLKPDRRYLICYEFEREKGDEDDAAIGESNSAKSTL